MKARRTAGGLTAAEYERAITWNLAIVAAVTSEPGRDEDRERRWPGGLTIDRSSGAWYSFTHSRGGHSSIELLKHLRPEYSAADAVVWLQAFLKTHPGTGALEAETGEWTQARQEASAALARSYLNAAEPLPPDGKEAAYLASRGLVGPFPETLQRIPSARPGEGALLMPLMASGRTVAVLLTYVDGLGRKSLVRPARRRLNIEHSPGAVMEIAAKSPGTIDISADVIICEGLENGLSINLVKHPAWRIIAVPGIATLRNLALSPEERRVIVFQDSDADEHPARKGLTAGVDALIAAGKQVRITELSEYGDANEILQAEGLGEKELRRLLAKPAGAALSFEGKVDQLSKLPETEYMKARREVAKDHKVPVSFLDREVTKRRPKPAEEDGDEIKPSISLPVDPPWTGPTPQLDLLLDRIVVAIRRHVVLKEWQAHLVAAWVALTYFVFDQRINLQVMPRLAVQSAAINSGKTALLRLVCTLVRHGKIYGRATSAGIYRALSQAELTLCLDEVEFLRNDPFSPMMQVLDSSHHREDANILLTEPQKIGPPIARELSTWAAMALACNGQLPGSLQSRSLVVVLMRALADDDHELLETRMTPELVGLRRELAAWAVTIPALPIPSRSEMPREIYNRDGDNWRPIFAIARLAGDRWLERIMEASLQALKTETLPSLTTRLLSSINLAFGDNPQPNTWLDTGELIARLIAQETEEWGTINRGRPTDAYWLRTQLRGLLDPPGAQEWWRTLADGRRQHHRGYFYNQFADAFRRYDQDELGTFEPEETHTAETLKSSSASGASGATREKPDETATFSAPDGAPDDFFDPMQEKPKETKYIEVTAPDAPHAPDQPDPISARVSKRAARSRKTKPNGPDPAPQQLDLVEYIAGTTLADDIAKTTLADDIRMLHANNPTRSIKWLAKQSGQPPSIVRAILEPGEGSQ
jgi:hypothetical protein